MDSPKFVYTFRFMWRLKDNNQIFFKVVTDTENGLKQFEETLRNVPNIELAAKEYLSQIDLSRMTIIENIMGGDKQDEKTSG